MHGAEAAVGSIVKPAQVQHAVERVQQQLHPQLNPPLFCLPPGLRDAYDDLAGRHSPASIVLQFEREDVGGAGDAHEALVELRHARIGDQRE